MVAELDINIAELRGRPLGRVLVKMDKLSRDQVRPIGEILKDLGYIDESALTLALAFQAGMEFVDLEKFDVPDDVVKQIPAQMANAYKVIPLDYDESAKHLTVALGSADNFRATDDLRTLMGYQVTAKIADPKNLERALHKYYDVEPESIGELINEIAGDEQLTVLENRGESIDLETIREMAESNPIRRLVNMVLLQAIRDRASDIHFEPFEDEYKVRYRIDGLLYEMIPPPKSISMAIASRIKVMADLDIAERRLPQDGRIELVINGQPVDLRISVLPTMFGESVVMRVLDRSQLNLDLEQVR
jgi:type IV pilus assembly protein PilB